MLGESGLGPRERADQRGAFGFGPPEVKCPVASAEPGALRDRAHDMRLDGDRDRATSRWRVAG